MINLVAWFGQFVGVLALVVALHITILKHKGVPIEYGVAFYVIGVVMLLINLDPLFSERVVSWARLLGTCIVFIVELYMIDHVRTQYDVGVKSLMEV
jgi:hypothetical protein